MVNPLAKYKKITVMFIRGDKKATRFDFAIDFTTDEDKNTETFLAEDLSSLTESEIKVIVKMIQELTRVGCVRSDFVDPTVGTITVALKRK